MLPQKEYVIIKKFPAIEAHIGEKLDGAGLTRTDAIRTYSSKANHVAGNSCSSI